MSRPACSRPKPQQVEIDRESAQLALVEEPGGRPQLQQPYRKSVDAAVEGERHYLASSFEWCPLGADFVELGRAWAFGTCAETENLLPKSVRLP